MYFLSYIYLKYNIIISIKHTSKGKIYIGIYRLKLGIPVRWTNIIKTDRFGPNFECRYLDHNFICCTQVNELVK